MRRWTLILLVVLVVPSFAGILVKREPKRVEIDGVSYGSKWSISSPTLVSSSGYLSYDVTGKSPKVTFADKKGPNTTWTFVEEKGYHYQSAERDSVKGERDIPELEKFGFSLKIRASEGPFAGWYLGRMGGELVLVKDPRKAATIVMVEREREVVHK